MQITEYYFEEQNKMHGVKRVLLFCVLMVVIPATLIIIPIYLRKIVFADVVYPVAESDIIEIRDGISSIFCQQHSLRMNTNFNAFQLRSNPEISTTRKHIRLKKSMTLPDDTLEYWGFYLLKGAKVHLKFCSRYDGSRILVVKGQRDLKTCGLLDHNNNKAGKTFAQGHEQVKVYFEDITEIAENVAIADLEKHLVDKNYGEDTKMEFENNASEDLSSDVDENAKTIAAAIQQTPKPRRKKLKKGSKQHTMMMHRNETIENESSYSNAKASLEQSNVQHRSSLAVSEIPTHFVNRQRRNLNITERVQQRHRASIEYRRHNRHYNKRLYDILYKRRTKREHVYDRKYSHGGNAVNFTETDESNSVSSFEDGLLQCYDGDILLAEGFPPSPDCLNAHFLENGSHRMLSQHEVTEDGYYYYIFYSDNDLVRNDIHAIFDIYKPTFQYSNVSEAQGCVNTTNCTFSIGFLSDEIVVVEVPTRDGIEHEEDDITYLISMCHPRTTMYAIFPITVLVLILSCSFI